MLRFFSEARKFATKLIRIGVNWRDPPLFPQKNYRKNRNEIFWIGNDPPIRKFSENSSNLVQVEAPNLQMHIIAPSIFQWVYSSGRVMIYKWSNGGHQEVTK